MSFVTCGRALRLSALVGLSALVSACVTPPPPYDYSAFQASKPVSLLILPPINETVEVSAVSGVLATATAPLAEAGYYVLPVSLVDETFRQNGLLTPNDIQAVPVKRLHDIFGADAAVYLKVTRYGTSYQVLVSDTRVTLEGRIVDLRTGKQIWDGKATASSTEQSGNNNGGLAGALIKALVEQVVHTSRDTSFEYAALANNRLLSVRPNGVLAGPRRPQAASAAP